MFPFIIKYSAIIEDEDLDKSQILTGIKQAVEEEKAKIVSVNPNEIIYSGTTARFATKWNFALSVDKARFWVLEENFQIILKYEIYLHKLFYFSFAAAIITGFVSFSPLGSLLALLWFGGVNMVIIYLQHRAFFHDVIDRLKPVAADVNDGETKKVLRGNEKKEAGRVTLIALLVMTLIVLLIMFLPL